MTELSKVSVMKEVSDMLDDLFRKAGRIVDHQDEYATFMAGFDLYNEKEKLLLAIFGKICYDRMNRWNFSPTDSDQPIGGFHDD